MPWWVARTHTFRIRVAIQHLTLRGFSVYCPRVRERSRKKYDRMSTVEAPLFPDYLFICVSASGQWYEANRCPGVVRLIRDGGVPALVRDAVIEDIKRREVAGLVELPERGLRINSPVRVVSGPFQGLNALVVGLNGAERCAILLELLGAPRRLELPKNHIEIIQPW
jgi:transcription antitermination factor NusG